MDREGPAPFQLKLHQQVCKDESPGVLKINNNLINYSGYSREEIVGKQIGKFCGESAQNLLLKELSQSKRLHDREVVMQVKDGTNKYMVLSASAIHSRSNRPIGLTFILTDITERKLAEIELANTKNYLETLLNSMLTSVFVIDAKTHQIVDVYASALSMPAFSMSAMKLGPSRVISTRIFWKPPQRS